MAEARSQPEQPQPTLTHEALLYRTSAGLCAQLSAFAAAARRAAEPLLAVLSPDSLALAQRALGSDGERVRWMPMAEVGHNPSCLLAVYQDWIDAHPGPVRVIAEPVWAARSHAETIECLRHEALLNHELAAARLTALCPYDAERLPAEVLAGAELTHPQLVDDDGRRHASPRYGEPLHVAAGGCWPQDAPTPPVTEHRFAGDLRSLRRAVAEDPIAGRLGAERRADLVFALNEGAANAIKHGDGTGTARLWGERDGVVGEIVTATALGDALVGRRRPPPDAADGRGLWLINQICDLVELRSDRATTVLRVHLHDHAA